MFVIFWGGGGGGGQTPVPSLDPHMDYNVVFVACRGCNTLYTCDS